MKKVGSEKPISATPTIPRSTKVPRRSAAITPLVTPTTIHSTKAPTARETVTGRPSAMIELTGVCRTKE